MKTYEITFPNFFDKPLTTTYKAETAGKAKYLCYLSFSDAYPITFDRFLKEIKCRKVG